MSGLFFRFNDINHDNEMCSKVLADADYQLADYRVVISKCSYAGFV